MKTYLYIRVSSEEQNTIRQEVKAKEYSIPTENVYIEEVSSKNVTHRPVLNNLMANLKNGDRLIVDSISRFARNAKDLLELVEQLNSKGVVFVSLRESIDTITPSGMFMITVFRAVAQLEREYIKDRQMEGISIAVEQGKFKGRKAIEYPKLWTKYYIMWKNNSINAVDVMKVLNLKKTTFYKLVNQYEEAR